ncbi:hypothetical protein M0811_01550 [Anaeramoeba ignava]|uniref:Uncharacterized protein n=1 Tax=Anaeramoeba ignava TaxID=1746090 RepID=A0A9Q0LHG3_ANAIG|nr:hypothetical protein M0811_01550 [Anaeramoeba ignava]
MNNFFILIFLLTIFNLTFESKQISTFKPEQTTIGAMFGFSAAMSNGFSVIGSPFTNKTGNSEGSVYIFEYQNNQWNQKYEFSPQYSNPENFFGFSVAIDEEFVVVGSPNCNDSGTSSGSAYVYQNTDYGWVFFCEILPNDSQIGGHFGYSVDVSGDQIIVGSYGTNESGLNSGSAYIFQQQEIMWIQKAKFVPADLNSGDYFGFSVGISNEYAIVGAPHQSVNGIDSGSAYLFYNNSGSWVQHSKLFASDGSGYDRFAWSVAIDNSYAVVGAFYHENHGAAYVFQNQNNNWNQIQILTANDAFDLDYFGRSVKIHNNFIVVGADGRTDNGITDSGAAYVFQNSNGNWIQSAKVVASDAKENWYFGYAVDVSDDLVIAGAYGADNDGYLTGQMYCYSDFALHSSVVSPFFPSSSFFFLFSIFFFFFFF